MAILDLSELCRSYVKPYSFLWMYLLKIQSYLSDKFLGMEIKRLISG